MTVVLLSLVTGPEEEERRRRRVKPGRITQATKSQRPDESEGCSPVSGGRTIRLCSLWLSDDLPQATPLRPPADTGAGDQVGASAKFAVVAETVCCREGVDLVVLR